MKNNNNGFDEHDVLHKLKHYLPAQAPLKDFIHHNTLHAFQNIPFESAIIQASEIFGYKVSLSIQEYRELYQQKRINKDILDRVISQQKGNENKEEWLEKMLSKEYPTADLPRIGSLRSHWKKQYQIDLDSLVHPTLFRILCSYLDQGISIWNFPVKSDGLLSSIRELERSSFTSFFRHSRAKKLLLQEDLSIKHLLRMLVGEEELYGHYIFDQQFAHQGWSGMVSTIEDFPSTLLDTKIISLHDLIILELLFEIDALDFQFGEVWAPLALKISEEPIPLFEEVITQESHIISSLWQEAFEWSYYDQVLSGIQSEIKEKKYIQNKSFQALFCIDDRECSIRRYIEQLDPNSETFATPGHFGVEFFFQPENGKFYTKLCPAPVTPKYLIKETGNTIKRKKDLHFTKHSHSAHGGFLITQTLGYWSAFKLFLNIIKPTMSPATASSFKHMDQYSTLTIENKNITDIENGLQIGFTIDEMVIRVESVLKSIGLIKDFAGIVYLIGHGSSSVNNPHYAAYDCGACSGRAGSVNARVFCYMANHPKVRALLSSKGIYIPETTTFIGGLHDTTRDEMMFFDENSLGEENKKAHIKNKHTFEIALDNNAKERSRRFESIDSKLSPKKIHQKILTRSVSLFEPRPELNHATNALCIIGSRELSKGIFLDRRSFMNSYDYSIDPEGIYLLNILKAAAPVCGGINLEYYFSRVDNQKLGAGTKLPHNVMGLFGVANGIDGDLRPGLPSQMIEVHDPIRLLIIVEHFSDVVLNTIKKLPETYEWFDKNWVHLITVNPETGAFSLFKEGGFTPYTPLVTNLETVSDLTKLFESHQENFPVYLIK